MQVVIEDVHGNDAQELADKIPGLIVVEGPKRAAVARPARDHPELLEKVGCVRVVRTGLGWAGMAQGTSCRQVRPSEVVLLLVPISLLANAQPVRNAPSLALPWRGNACFRRCCLQRSCRPTPAPAVQVRALASDERWQKRVRLRRDKTHFLFTIQSTGQLPPDRLFEMALDQLSEKADSVLQQLDPAEV